MTREEFKQIAAGLRIAFANHNFMPNQSAFDMWYEMLKDLTYESVNKAAVYHIQTEKFPPTIADLRKNSMKVTVKEFPSELDAWQMVSKALRNGYYGAEQEFAKLPEIVQKAVGDPSNLRNWSQTDLADIETVVASNFQRTYRVVCKREQEVGQVSSYIRDQLPQNQTVGIEKK